MKLILLPGLDGTRRLFKPFIDALNCKSDLSIIELPSGENQSYDFITQCVREKLPPNEPFILLAESFSGPIAYRLLQDEVKNIITVIFVATFLKRPTFLIKLAAKLVAGFMLKRTFVSTLVVKALMTGFDSTQETLQMFWDTAEQVGIRTLKLRLEAISTLPRPTQRISRPCYYIQAENDFLVPRNNFLEFKKHFENIKLYRINGPHLLLQTRANECARVIEEIAAL